MAKTPTPPPIFTRYTTPAGPAETPPGSTRFEQARARLAKLAGRDVEYVGDADVQEYLTRGEQATRDYLGV